jgi:hypothetical protein
MFRIFEYLVRQPLLHFQRGEQFRLPGASLFVKWLRNQSVRSVEEANSEPGTISFARDHSVRR